MCTVSMEKWGYKSVGSIRFLRVISLRTKLCHLVAQQHEIRKQEICVLCLWDHSDLLFSRSFMLSGHPDYEPLLLVILSNPNDIFGGIVENETDASNWLIPDLHDSSWLLGGLDKNLPIGSATTWGFHPILLLYQMNLASLFTGYFWCKISPNNH